MGRVTGAAPPQEGPVQGVVAEDDLERHELMSACSGSSTKPAAPPSQPRRRVGVREQAAVVRALFDELEQLLPGNDGDAVGAQVAEELTRLACTLMQVAAALSVSGLRR
jgi:hypothetical protein